MSNGSDYTAMDLATATPGEWKEIMKSFSMEGYEKYFAKFDQSQLSNIYKNYRNKMGQLDEATKQIGTKVGEDFGKLGGQKRQFTSQRGFETSGDVTAKLGMEKEKIVGKAEDQYKTAEFKEEEFGLKKEQDVTKAVTDQHEQFYSQLGAVEMIRGPAATMVDTDGDGTPDSPSGSTTADGTTIWHDDDPNRPIDVQIASDIHGAVDEVRSWWGEADFGGGDENKEGPFCVVSTALNTSGAWSDSEKRDAVNWCQETHHDGSDRGKTWSKGYHT